MRRKPIRKISATSRFIRSIKKLPRVDRRYRVVYYDIGTHEVYR